MSLAALSEINTRMVKLCVAALPENWRAFWIKAECNAPDSWGWSAWFELDGLEAIQQFEVPSEADECIVEAWKASREMNDDWTVFEMTVKHPGDMRIVYRRVDLDDLSEMPDARSNEFEKRTFGDRKQEYPPLPGAISLTRDMLDAGLLDSAVEKPNS